ncbi:MAG TPA: SRPBCC family protein [Pyrinomonadaceae bacterium]|nr:SRPBCC family protein [Pyrinomonadaceae bacterium]
MTNKIEAPIAKAQLLIRKPVQQVFEALVDPAITSRFWFSKGSGRLETGRRIRWDWEMYGHHTEVEVKAIEMNKRILIEWNGPENPTAVEWTFEDKGNDTTFVAVKNWGFKGTDDKVVAQALDSTGGFTFVLAALKVFVEHGIEPNFVVDHAPDSLVEGWTSRRAAGSGLG